MTRNINSDAENCQAEVGVPRGGIHSRWPRGVVLRSNMSWGGGQFTPGGYFLRNTPVSMGLTSDTKLSVLSTVWVRLV